MKHIEFVVDDILLGKNNFISKFPKKCNAIHIRKIIFKNKKVRSCKPILQVSNNFYDYAFDLDLNNTTAPLLLNFIDQSHVSKTYYDYLKYENDYSINSTMIHNRLILNNCYNMDIYSVSFVDSDTNVIYIFYLV